MLRESPGICFGVPKELWFIKEPRGGSKGSGFLTKESGPVSNNSQFTQPGHTLLYYSVQSCLSGLELL